MKFVVGCSTVKNGDDEFCNCNPCTENEGDCDYNHHCQDGVFCGSNNCPASLGFDSDVDCCTSAEIMSPNYPYLYPSSTKKTWFIIAPVGSFINLQFHSLRV